MIGTQNTQTQTEYHTVTLVFPEKDLVVELEINPNFPNVQHLSNIVEQLSNSAYADIRTPDFSSQDYV